jgi:predicted metal-dependent enzyme (double-stranded beta helix superfamily)
MTEYGSAAPVAPTIEPPQTAAGVAEAPVCGPPATATGVAGLANVPRPRGRDLSGPELQQFVSELADRPELWIEFVKHDTTQRVYEELLSDEHVTAWLICWMNDHDTGFHDHDISAGAVAVVSGAVREERLAIDGPPRNSVYQAGASFHFSPADIHRVRHAGGDPAVTLHVYSPPLLRMGAYEIGDDGVLERHPMSYLEELRPLEEADGTVERAS